MEQDAHEPHCMQTSTAVLMVTKFPFPMQNISLNVRLFKALHSLGLIKITFFLKSEFCERTGLLFINSTFLLLEKRYIRWYFMYPVPGTMLLVSCEKYS